MPDRMLDAVVVVARRRAVLIVLLAGLIAAVIGLVVLGNAYEHQRDRADRATARVEAGEQATAVARAAATRLTTYSYQSLDQDFSWVDAVGTASFKRTFAATATKAKQVITATKATGSGEVIAAAPQVTDARHVRVLLFVDQTVTTPADTAGSVDQSRISIDLVRQQGRWLVDAVNLEQVGG